VQRRHRLSRSRDFDAVYRRGRSTSTRFLTAYRLEREDDPEAGEPRLGVAVPRKVGNAVVRNRVKRQLREAWVSVEPDGRSDYVLVARPGLPEAVEAQGFDWLRERVGEVLQEAAA
jgi:ribonuclease P protein component